MAGKVEIIKGNPIGKANHYIATPHGIVKDEIIREYERNFLSQCVIYRDKRINVPFSFSINVFFSRTGADLDNVLKTILDTLQYAGAITNDSLCTEIIARKYISYSNPRIEYSITPFQTNLELEL